MDVQSFWRELGSIRDEIGYHRSPIVELVQNGSATRAQLERIAICNYHMTVRDADVYTASGFINLAALNPQASTRLAHAFAEEALGIHSSTAGHAELLFEFWERGLGRQRLELESSIAPAAVRAFNAEYWTVMTRKIRYCGIPGYLGEGIFSNVCQRLYDGLTRHYHMEPDALRFFSVHVEEDREHSEEGHDLLSELAATDRDREDFVLEARCWAQLQRGAWDAML
jgi:pyrroloquinoline quinone (PQQ) biosynthesis protein C